MLFQITGIQVRVIPKAGQSADYFGGVPDIAFDVDGGTLPEDAFTGKLSLDGGAVSAGTHRIVLGTLALKPEYAENYTLVLEEGVLFTINQKQVTVTPTTGQSMTYTGGAPASIALTHDAPITLHFTGALALENQAVTAGDHRIVVGTLALTEADAANYRLVLAAEPVTYRIDKRTVTVTPKAGQFMEHTGSGPESILFDNDAGLEASAFTGALALENGASDVGTHTIVLGSLNVADTDNNTLVLAAEPVTFEIRRPFVTVTPTPGQGKTYDGQTVSGGIAYTSDKDLEFTGSLALEDGARDAGSHTIVQGTLAVGGADAGKYDIVVAPETYAIQPMALTVTPDAGQSKTYDGETAGSGITYTIAAGTLAQGDTLTGALALENGAKDAGSHRIVQGTLTASANYTLTFTQGVDYTIAKAPLTITPRAGQSKTADGRTADDILYDITAGELYGEDELTGSLALEGGAADVGVHAVVLGTLDNPNYSITLQDGVYEIRAQETTAQPGTATSTRSAEGSSTRPAEDSRTQPADQPETTAAAEPDGADTGMAFPATAGALAVLAALALAVSRRKAKG